MATSSTNSPSRASRWLREPLLHFILIGLAILGLDLSFSNDEADQRLIEVTPELREELAAEFENQMGRPPDAEERERMVDDWVRDEVLYRRGVELGLDVDDDQIRGRIVRKTSYLYEGRLEKRDPSEEELRAHFEANRERYGEIASLDFSHVYCRGDEGRTRCEAFLERLEAGANSTSLGDRFKKGRRFRKRTTARIGENFGDAFAEGIGSLAANEWALLESDHGWHVVRIDKRRTGVEPDFEAKRADVESDWRAEQLKAQFEDEIQALRSEYTIRGVEP